MKTGPFYCLGIWRTANRRHGDIGHDEAEGSQSDFIAFQRERLRKSVIELYELSTEKRCRRRFTT